MGVEVEGGEPLADGMRISVRVRRDFVVTDAGWFLRAAVFALPPGVS